MRETTHYPYFDYLRAFAALGVFVSHADPLHLLHRNFGNACVQLFFALSGFLIGSILLRSHPKDLPRFYFNRAVRIWIPYGIAILLLAIATWIKQGFSEPKFIEIFFYMGTFVYNWFGTPQLSEFRSRMPLDGSGNGFWSICVEEQFYLVAPFLILFVPRLVLFMGLAIANYLSPNFFAAISLGVVLAIVGPKTWVIAGTAAAGAILAFTGPYIASVAALSCAVVGLLARLPGSPTTLGRIAGGASYSFYLNQWIGLIFINVALKIGGAPYWLAWCSGLFVLIALSTAHYLLIDRNIARNRDSWFTPRRGILLWVTGIILVIIGLVGAIGYSQQS